MDRILIKKWAFPSKRRDRSVFKAKSTYWRWDIEHWILLIVIARFKSYGKIRD